MGNELTRKISSQLLRLLILLDKLLKISHLRFVITDDFWVASDERKDINEGGRPL